MELSQISIQTAGMPQTAVASAPAAPALDKGPQPAATPPPAAAPQANTEQVKQAMNEVQNAVKSMAQNLQFSVDKDTGMTIVKVVDANTDQVIRQIPAEEIVTIAKAIDQMQGLLLRQKA